MKFHLKSWRPYHSGWLTQTGIADRSADWKRILESGAYPYAKFPLTKLIFHLPGVEAGRWLCLNTLLAATHLAEPAYQVSEPEPGLICVESLHNRLPDLCMDNQDLSVRVKTSCLEVRFDMELNLPEALRDWSATA